MTRGPSGDRTSKREVAVQLVLGVFFLVIVAVSVSMFGSALTDTRLSVIVAGLTGVSLCLVPLLDPFESGRPRGRPVCGGCRPSCIRWWALSVPQRRSFSPLPCCRCLGLGLVL
jgi:hypothetical protein